MNCRAECSHSETSAQAILYSHLPVRACSEHVPCMHVTLHWSSKRACYKLTCCTAKAYCALCVHVLMYRTRPYIPSVNSLDIPNSLAVQQNTYSPRAGTTCQPGCWLSPKVCISTREVLIVYIIDSLPLPHTSQPHTSLCKTSPHTSVRITSPHTSRF